jgi:hypothetical protein
MAEVDDQLKALEGQLSSNSDIVKAMEEMFKDVLDKIDKLHSIDLRTRLVGSAVRGHSIINFLASLKVKEADNQSLAPNLEVFAISLKRHMISHQGKSRAELIELFKTRADAMMQGRNLNLMGQMPK